jgi:hypothetical protein
MNWAYVSKNDPSEDQKRLRHLLHKQILMSNVKLRPTTTIDSCDIRYSLLQDHDVKYVDIDMNNDNGDDIDSDVDIREFI